MPQEYETQTWEQEEAAAKDRRARENFKREYSGPGNADEAYEMSKVVAAAEVRSKAKEAARVDEGQLAVVHDAFRDALMTASHFRGRELSDADQAELVRQAADDIALPPAGRRAFEEELGKIVKQANDSGDYGAARQAARASAWKIARALPATWAPRDDKAEDLDTASILARVPRS
jgi:hypothetical protein